MIFWLINLEIADFYSAGRYVEIDFSRHLQRDLDPVVRLGPLCGRPCWYWDGPRGSAACASSSLGFLLLTVGKVFVYDLAQLSGLYRILSFLALGVSLILVSLLYQRFARRDEAAAS